jgi:hypothetical protein
MQIFWMDVSLIWVSPECHDTGGLAYLYHGTLGWEAYLSSDRKKKKARNGSSLSDLCRLCRLASRRWLIGISSSKRWKLRTPFRVMGMMVRLAASPCQLDWRC